MNINRCVESEYKLLDNLLAYKDVLPRILLNNGSGSLHKIIRVSKSLNEFVFANESLCNLYLKSKIKNRLFRLYSFLYKSFANCDYCDVQILIKILRLFARINFQKAMSLAEASPEIYYSIERHPLIHCVKKQALNNVGKALKTAEFFCAEDKNKALYKIVQIQALKSVIVANKIIQLMNPQFKHYINLAWIEIIKVQFKTNPKQALQDATRLGEFKDKALLEIIRIQVLTDISQAFEILKLISEGYYKDKALYAIIDQQILSSADEALKTVQVMSEFKWKNKALSNIATHQALTSIAAALKTANEINDSTTKENALCNIAEVQGLKNFKEAIETAKTFKNDEQDKAIKRLVVQQAKSNLNEVLEFAKLQIGYQKEKLISLIVKVLAETNAKEALEMANLLGSFHREGVISDIIKVQAKTNVKEALETAQLLNGYNKDNVLAHIITFQAAESIEGALAISKQITYSGCAEKAIANIAKVQSITNPRRATQIAASLNINELQAKVLSGILKQLLNKN